MANTNIGDHRWLAQDDLRDGPIQNIAFYLPSTPVAGNLAGGTKVNTLAAATAGLNTTETILTAVPLIIPGTDFGQSDIGSINIGTIVRFTAMGTCTSTNADVQTFTLRMGTAGTVAGDTSISTWTITSAGSGSAIGFKFVADVSIRTLSATAGTAYFAGTLLNTGVTGIAAAAVTVKGGSAITAFTTTLATFLDLTYLSAATTSTCTFQVAYAELLP